MTIPFIYRYILKGNLTFNIIIIIIYIIILITVIF